MQQQQSRIFLKFSSKSKSHELLFHVFLFYLTSHFARLRNFGTKFACCFFYYELRLVTYSKNYVLINMYTRTRCGGEANTFLSFFFREMIGFGTFSESEYSQQLICVLFYWLLTFTCLCLCSTYGFGSRRMGSLPKREFINWFFVDVVLASIFKSERVFCFCFVRGCVIYTNLISHTGLDGAFRLGGGGGGARILLLAVCAAAELSTDAAATDSIRLWWWLVRMAPAPTVCVLDESSSSSSDETELASELDGVGEGGESVSCSCSIVRNSWMDSFRAHSCDSSDRSSCRKPYWKGEKEKLRELVLCDGLLECSH